MTIEVTELVPVDVQVLVDEEDNTVYVKFTGFENVDEADEYALFLQEYLHLMLFQSEVLH
jgi:hypothetical protein